VRKFERERVEVETHRRRVHASSCLIAVVLHRRMDVILYAGFIYVIYIYIYVYSAVKGREKLVNLNHSTFLKGNF